MALNSRVSYTGDGSTSIFSIPFPYISRTHVKVKINNTELYPYEYEWLSDSSIRIKTIPKQGDAITIHRETPYERRLVDFQNGAVLTEAELDLAHLQNFYISQEIRDIYVETLENGLTKIASDKGWVPTDADAIIQQLVNETLNHELAAELRQRVTDIDVASETILDVASRLQDLKATVDSLADVNGTGIVTFIQNEQNERIAGDAALAEDLRLLGAKSADNTAFIIDTNTVRVDPTTSLAERFTALDASVDGVNSLIAQEASTRTNADNALAQNISLLEARVDTVEGDVAANQAAILNEQTTRADALSAEAAARQVLEAKVDTKNRVWHQGTAPEAGGVGDLWFNTAENNKPYVWNGSQWVVAQDGDIKATLEADILTEQSARIAADQAIADELHLLGAKNGTNTAFILDENKVLVDSGSTSLASRLSGLDSQITGVQASIVSEQTARTAADSALAQDITQLTTTVNGHSSSITQFASSISGLEARYGVSLDVNGYITGFVQNNDGESGTFAILADKFHIVDPSKGLTTPKPVFSVSNGNVYMQNAYISNAWISDLKVDKLTGGALNANITQNGDITVGTGRIIWDNGTVMMVEGLGFGTNNQFIEWFGPSKPSPSLCSEADAIRYLKTDGSAYYGGSLSAGVYKNGASSTIITSSPSVEVGPFGTRGNPISVVCSLAMGGYQVLGNFNMFNVYSDRTSPWGGPVTARLYKLSGSSWTQVATGSFQGYVRERLSDDQELGTGSRYDYSMSGSFTWTDTAGGTDDRTLKLTAENVPAFPTGVQNRSQVLTLLATEE